MKFADGDRVRIDHSDRGEPDEYGTVVNYHYDIEAGYGNRLVWVRTDISHYERDQMCYAEERLTKVDRPEKHDKRTCEHCHNGFRTDFMFADHFGAMTKAARDCEASIKPCRRHECYVVMEIRKRRK